MARGYQDGRRIDYLNVPRRIAQVVSSRHATLVELQTILGAKDLEDLYEIILVDSHNASLPPKNKNDGRL